MIQKAIQYPALIKYLKGFSNYTWLHYCDGRKVLVAKSLCFFEKRLPGFFRVHKTALVNPYYIMDFKAPPGHKMAGSISLKDGVTLPVSRRRWGQIIDLLSVALVSSSASFQADKDSGLSALTPPLVESGGKASRNPVVRTIWVVMADEIKGGLLQQYMAENWPQWRLLLFETSTGLQKALLGVDDAEMPAMIVLDGGQTTSMVTLQLIKSSPRFRFIPTILLTSAASHDLAQQGYASGANSVIIHPTDLTRFIQVLEKIFRYWLSMASPPQVVSAGIRAAVA
ncbi:hypothetical protein GCM10028803_05710 [Larkinella knui]|uniref:HTH LytTR-type domain-containing protein n=1 Tax=Larkinella knui TaxID=2025310 RepID=A0A3P1CLG6_9BACT|nr:LytTR family transcriptional regulator DNA-binding domain-containing protein [Larkinella knui]RRB13754.1 hypothetical protein EHT87_15955 [Larkinella knui]